MLSLVLSWKKMLQSPHIINWHENTPPRWKELYGTYTISKTTVGQMRTDGTYCSLISRCIVLILTEEWFKDLISSVQFTNFMQTYAIVEEIRKSIKGCMIQVCTSKLNLNWTFPHTKIRWLKNLLFIYIPVISSQT